MSRRGAAVNGYVAPEVISAYEVIQDFNAKLPTILTLISINDNGDIVLTSPNGTQYALRVTDVGELITEVV